MTGPSRPHAQIRQIGRWTWRVTIHHGCMVWGPDGYGWRVLGRRRAERKARRVLAQYLRIQARNTQPPTVVTADDLAINRTEQP